MFDGYYIWLTNLIDTDSHLAGNYRKVLHALYCTPFVWFIQNDCNRNLDGLDLRERYEGEVGMGAEVVYSHLDGDCSVLEMMVALAIRMENDIMHDDNFGDRTSDWFWNMIRNLGLENCPDEHFDESFVVKTMDIFLFREYSRDGRGSLFVLNNCRKDLRKIEIWYQMNFWLNENFAEFF